MLKLTREFNPRQNVNPLHRRRRGGPGSGSQVVGAAQRTAPPLPPSPGISTRIPQPKGQLGAELCEGARSHGYIVGDSLYFLPFVFAQAPGRHPRLGDWASCRGEVERRVKPAQPGSGQYQTMWAGPREQGVLPPPRAAPRPMVEKSARESGGASGTAAT